MATYALGCSSRSDPSEKNFERALEAFFEADCEADLLPPFNADFALGLQSFPLSVRTGQTGMMVEILDAYTTAGLLDREAEGEQTIYNLTSEGRELYRTGPPRFCYGNRELEEVTNFTINGPNEATVYYTYTIDGEDWIDKHEDFSLIRRSVETAAKGPAKDSARLVLTAKGWRHGAMVSQ